MQHRSGGTEPRLLPSDPRFGAVSKDSASIYRKLNVLPMRALVVLSLLLSCGLVVDHADGARVRKEAVDTATTADTTTITNAADSNQNPAASNDIVDTIGDMNADLRINTTPAAGDVINDAGGDALPPNMEMACHRRFNGSLWCAPMEKYEPDQVVGSGNMSANLVTVPDEYGTGLRINMFGEYRERIPSPNASLDLSLRTIDVPDSFSWYPDYVSPVKHQGKCGSCVAFASMGAVETCFRRVTGKFGDYSEQEMIDCGFGHNGGDGCRGAELDSYLSWMLEQEVDPAGEDQYPYSYTKPSLTCPEDVEYDPGLKARVTDYYTTNKGTETRLKEMVFRNGGVLSTVGVNQKFKEYTGGVFDKCPPDQPVNHAVLVVGYGTTQTGVDYWLIKNSWGVGWGEDGFMRIKRGARMCGIGRWLAYVECEAVDESNDNAEDYSQTKEDEEGGGDDYADNYVDEEQSAPPPRTTKNSAATASSCVDSSSNCVNFPQRFCTIPKGIATHCAHYCGLC